MTLLTSPSLIGRRPELPQFQLRTAGLDFHSTAYEWLDVTGNDHAMFKGVGTIDGEGPTGS